MNSPEPRPRRQVSRREDTWVTLAIEITRSVLPYRSRTMNAVLLLSIPLAVVTATIVTVVTVLIPHPAMALGAVLSSAGVALIAWIKSRLTAHGALPPAPAPSDPGSPDPSSPQPP